MFVVHRGASCQSVSVESACCYTSAHINVHTFLIEAEDCFIGIFKRRKRKIRASHLFYSHVKTFDPLAIQM